ncbi:flagellar hook assembly protein FlgD, partial [Ralstonia pseudosolanacearum]|uniref:flagellar hook assembly protein FlgD n=3 Tax=Burkholderiales TaxID=80840 RepID=UPI003D29AC89
HRGALSQWPSDGGRFAIVLTPIVGVSIMAIDSTAAASASTQLGMQDLLKVLLAQLTNQNPLKPMENQDFIGQIAQFSSLEQSRQTYAKLDQLVGLQSTLQSVGLIGKTVDVQSATGSITGVVTALSLASGSPMLSVRTSSGSIVNDLSLGSVSAIR